jgi:Skp family chaperone for outer membrane proteins
MTFKPFAVGLCAAAAALTAGSSAVAQTARPAAPAAAPAQPAVNHGPPIPNMCIISIENAIGASTVGRYVDTRMQQIVAQTNAELTGEKNAIDADAKALEARRATLDQSTLEQQASALQVRANALQRKAQLRDREVSATEQKAVGRIGQEMEPLIRQVYQSRGCSVLLQRTAVVIANPAMDITPSVITALNGKITQFAFDRERLDQPQAATGAGGAPPIVQTPGPTPRPAPTKR